MTDKLNAITELAIQNPDVIFIWLYGSRAKGSAHLASDYDLAMAFHD